jgi:hypothetical protein
VRSLSFSVACLVSLLSGSALAQAPVWPTPVPPAPAQPAPVAPTAAPVAPAPGAAPVPVAPAPAGAASQDRDAPETTTAVGRPLPFYIPTPEERLLAPPPAELPFMFSLLEDTHGFVSGSIRGFGDETRIRFGTDQGITLGTFNFNTFEFGYDAFRYRGIKVYEQPSGSHLNVYVLLPNLDIRGFISGSRLATAIGTSVSGIRVATCRVAGCGELSLRLLTLDSWYAGNYHGGSFAFSVGGGLSAGIKL